MSKNVLIIVGPTAIGKTYLSIELAKQFNAEIISADSMQIYKHMDIGTAKVTVEEACGIKHHMIDIINPEDNYSVSEFQLESDRIIKELLEQNKLPIVVGGSGLYVNSIMYDLNFSESKSDNSIREYYTDYYNKNGKDALYELLLKVDPEAAMKIHKNNVKRVIRALEVYKKTGQKFSMNNTDIRKPSTKYNCIVIGLNMDREKLYKRINQRVDKMINEGLIEEVEKLLNMGYSEDLVSMQGIGYKEIIDYLKGRISREESIEILKRNTRRFAKRQLTWFNGDSNIKWFNVDDINNIDLVVKEVYEYVDNIL